MPAQRPTTLALFANHCPKAVDHYEAGKPRLSGWSPEVGIAAHEILYAIAIDGMEAVPGTVRRLITEGRRGVDSDPPLRPERVFEGRDLAIRYVEQVGLPTRDVATFEAGLAFKRNWTTADYDSEQFPDVGGPWFRCRIDCVEVIDLEDEESSGRGLVVRDYKTSWAEGAGWLDSIQAKSYAVAAWMNWKRFMPDGEQPDFIRREIVNLRTLQVHNADVWLDDDGDATLKAWRDDIDMTTDGAMDRPRIAAPGPRCFGCPYVLVCEDAAWIAANMEGPTSRETNAMVALALFAPAAIATATELFYETLTGGNEGAQLTAFRNGMDTVFAWLQDRARQAQAILQSQDDVLSPAVLAAQWAATAARAEALEDAVKATASDGPIEVGPDLVGYYEKPSRTPEPDAGYRLWRAWTGDRDDLDEGTTSFVVGLLSAMKVGMSQVTSVARKLKPTKDDKPEREAIIAQATRPTVSRKFGVRPRPTSTTTQPAEE